MQQLTDIQLFNLVQGDSQQAFALLIDRYSKVLFRHINRRTGSEKDSEELLQNIFLSLWNNRARLHFENDLYPYLFRAAKYEVIDWSVRNEKQLAREALLLSELKEATEYPAEEVLIASELKAFLEKEVSAMPQTMQNVFRLSRDEQLPAGEIARKLGISEQTVRNNINLALNRLRIRLKREHYMLLAGTMLVSLQ